MQITKMDVKEVADAISSRFERDTVRLVTMGLSFDEDFGDCIRIVVYLDEDTTMDDIKGRTAGFTAQVMGLLRDELKDLWPFVGFKKYSKDNAPDLLDQGGSVGCGIDLPNVGWGGARHGELPSDSSRRSAPRSALICQALAFQTSTAFLSRCLGRNALQNLRSR